MNNNNYQFYSSDHGRWRQNLTQPQWRVVRGCGDWLCAEACTFGALVNQTRRSYTDLTCPFGILEAHTFGRVNLSKNYLANGISHRLLSAAER